MNGVSLPATLLTGILFIPRQRNAIVEPAYGPSILCSIDSIPGGRDLSTWVVYLVVGVGCNLECARKSLFQEPSISRTVKSGDTKSKNMFIVWFHVDDGSACPVYNYTFNTPKLKAPHMKLAKSDDSIGSPPPQQATSGISGVNWTVSSLLPGTSHSSCQRLQIMTGAFTISIPGNKIAGTIGVFKPAHFMKPFFESVPCFFYHLFRLRNHGTRPTSDRLKNSHLNQIWRHIRFFDTKNNPDNQPRLDLASAPATVTPIESRRISTAQKSLWSEMGMGRLQNDLTQIKERLQSWS